LAKHSLLHLKKKDFSQDSFENKQRSFKRRLVSFFEGLKRKRVGEKEVRRGQV